MKTIGILTLNFKNYGTKLQAYALAKVLKTTVGDNAYVQVIDVNAFWGGIYRSTVYRKLLLNSFKTYGFFKACRYVIEKIRWKIEQRKILKGDFRELTAERSRLFKSIDALIPFTRQSYSYDDIRKGKLSFVDLFIVGSDQVWNILKVGNLDIFMLGFIRPQKGLTYAASFGLTEIPKALMEEYKRKISNFNSLLIREQEGVELCKKLGREDAKLVLDPTLLLEAKEYDEVLEQTPLVDEDYILVYSLNQSYRIYQEADRLCQRLQCKLVVLKRSICPPNISAYENAQELYAVSPGGFLWLVRHAKCVITNSYHALLYSINFNVPFYLYLDNADEENSRMVTVANLFGLSHRVCWESGHIPNAIGKIDYDSVNAKLREERVSSKAALKAAIELYGDIF